MLADSLLAKSGGKRTHLIEQDERVGVAQVLFTFMTWIVPFTRQNSSLNTTSPVTPT
jgi:hypothetical protein